MIIIIGSIRITPNEPVKIEDAEVVEITTKQPHQLPGAQLPDDQIEELYREEQTVKEINPYLV